MRPVDEDVFVIAYLLGFPPLAKKASCVTATSAVILQRGALKLVSAFDEADINANALLSPKNLGPQDTPPISLESNHADDRSPGSQFTAGASPSRSLKRICRLQWLSDAGILLTVAGAAVAFVALGAGTTFPFYLNFEDHPAPLLHLCGVWGQSNSDTRNVAYWETENCRKPRFPECRSFGCDICPGLA